MPSRGGVLSPRAAAWGLCAGVVAFVAYQWHRCQSPVPLPVIKSAPATALPAPSAGPKHFGGRAISEPARMAAALNNEVLHRRLEEQQARMGIIRIAPPARDARELRTAARAAGLLDEGEVKPASLPVRISGRFAVLLSGQPSGAAVHAASSGVRGSSRPELTQ